MLRLFDPRIIYSLAKPRNYLYIQGYSVCLLDWNLPDGTGLEFCTLAKEKMPLLFLTVRDGRDDILSAFSAGADDFVTKPFDLEILYSRLLAVSRRFVRDSVLSCGPICLDPASMTVSVSGLPVDLARNEYLVLLKLLENKGRTVTRDILFGIWDSLGTYVNDNTLSVTVKRLREKLGNPACLKTIRSFGYRLEED